jgi:ubiquinone biosynthesis protein UbiJ
MDPVASLANHAFEREGWARERLAAHAGRVVVVVIGPVATGMRIDSSGRFQSTPLAGRAADLTLTLSPLGVPSLLANPARWSEFVTVDGDAALAATLQELAHTMPWFVEQAFANALGPILGQRVADAGRRLLAFPEYAAARVGESVASYARDEVGLLPHGDEMRMFAEQTRSLAERADMLAARFDALTARLSKTKRTSNRRPKIVASSPD